MTFVDRLVEGLTLNGITSKIDRTDIYSFEDWWARIQTLISEADTVVFVLSPDSIESDICSKEVEYALSLNKRFAPIVCRPIASEAHRIPPELASLNFIFFDAETFDSSLVQLVEALTTDIAWIRKQTQFGLDAKSWEEAKHPKNLLLRSPRLEQAENWMASRPSGAPVPTNETLTFIRDSRREATRRRKILVSGLVTGLVVAVGLATAAIVFGFYAQREKDEADKQTVEAVRQRDLARKAKLESDKRAGLLATNVARKYTERGSYIAASLLLIDALKAFTPADIPDALLIAGSEVIDHLENASDFEIEPNSRVIDTDRMVFVTNDKSKNVWIYDDDGLSKLVDGKTLSAPIFTAAALDDGSYIFLTDDQNIELLCKGCKQPKVIAHFPSLAPYKLHYDEDWHSTASVFLGNWLIRQSPVDSGPSANDNGKTIFDIMNIRDMSIYRVESAWQDITAVGKIGGRDTFFAGGAMSDPVLLQVSKKNDVYDLVPMDAEQNSKLKDTLPFAECMRTLAPKMRPVALKDLQGQNRFRCQSFGKYGLLTIITSAASQDNRSDIVLSEDGVERTLDDIYNAHGESANQATSVAIDPNSGRIAVIQDKNIFMINGSSVDQVIKNQNAPGAVRFTNDGRLVIFDGSGGHIRILQAGSTDIHTTFQPQDEKPIKIEFYHIGGCPFSDPEGTGSIKQRVEGPDGQILSLERNKVDRNSKLTLAMWAKTSKAAPAPVVLGVSCLQISRDFKSALVKKDKRLTLYPHFRGPSEMGIGFSLPLDAGEIYSAFIDETDGSVITTDGTSSVTRWSFNAASARWTSTLIYEGDLSIIFAEPDPSGHRLILEESAGMGVRRGLMYSLTAKERWFDLGENYRMFSLRAEENGDVAVFKDYHLSDAFHVLSAQRYTELLLKKLPARCRYVGGSPPASPCWPQSLPLSQ